MAFDRKVELSVGYENDAVLVSGLHIEFKVERSIEFSANTGEFKIFNPSEDTASKFLKKGASVILKAGYADEGISVIYVGQITDSTAYWDGPTRVVDLVAGSIQNANRDLSFVSVSLSYSRGSSISSPLSDIANALGLATYGVQIAKGVTLANGFAFSGSARGALSRCRTLLIENGLNLFIDNTTLVVCEKKTSDTRFSVVYLSPESGLIGVSKANNVSDADNTKDEFPNKVSFTSLLNPMLQPNGVVSISSDQIEGVFIIERLTFTGSNYGGTFTTQGEAVGK